MVELWHHGEGNDVIDGQLITSARAAGYGWRTSPPHFGQSFGGKASLKLPIFLFEQIARGGCESSIRGLTEGCLLTS